MERALVSVAQKTEDKDAESTESTCQQVPPTSAAPAAQLPSSLKGVSQSLLDRVRKAAGAGISTLYFKGL